MALVTTIAEQVGPRSRPAFVGSERDWVLREYSNAHDIPFFELPRTLPGFWSTWRSLRRQRFASTAVLLANHPGYYRLKLLGLLLGRGVVVGSETGDTFVAAPAPLLRHFGRRFAQQVQRRLDRLRTFYRFARSQGLRPLWARARTRIRATLVNRSSTVLKARASAIRPRNVEVPTTEAPVVSIVIPVRNQWHFTHRCLESIVRHTALAYEVILVDDASSDATREAEARVPGLRVVRLTENQGFVGACNAGAEAARGRFVLFLNNDTVANPGWLSPMVELFDREADCGAVGAKLIYPNGRLQEAGGIVWRTGEAWNYGRGGDPELPEHSYARRVDYCSGAALMVRRDLLQRIGGFSPEFAPGYWEDTDLCFALRAEGFDVWFQPASRLIHFEGASAGRNERRKMKRFQSVNGEKFRQKWRRSLSDQEVLDPGNLFWARDRNRGPVVLVVDHYVPTHDRDAGSAFMSRLLESLVALGYRVIFWPDNRFRTPIYTDRLQELGIEVRYGPSDFAAYVRTHHRFIDHAILYRSSICEPYLSELEGLVSSIAYVAVDLEHVREMRRGLIEPLQNPVLVEELRRREERIVSRVDHVAAHSQPELDLLHREFGLDRERLHLLPLPILEGAATSTPHKERRDVAFVGSTHPPNVDAVVHFVDEVLPAVRQELGDVRLHVIGDVCRDLRSIANRPGVELVGFAEDLAAELSRIRVFVAPVRYGAGIKGKILTAMKLGLPVVTTSVGVEGIGVVPGVNVEVADHPESMAATVLELYRDPERWQRQRDAGWLFVEESYSDERFRQAIEGFMDSLVAGESCQRELRWGANGS